MINGNMRKAALTVVTVFLMASLLVSIPTIASASTAPDGEMGTILIDYSHGAFKASAEFLDLQLADNLTLMGFEVIFIWGGLNDTILATADGLILPKVWGAASGYLASEVTAVGDWFNAGNKFLWIGGESDFVEADGGQVFVHSPTCLYGSDSDTPGENVTPVALETESIDNVYVLLQYSTNATIVDSDLTLPYTHEDGEHGAFPSVTLELLAGGDGSGAIVVSGGNVIGSYWPMMETSYAGVEDMDGMRFVKNLIQYGMLHAMTEQGEGKILFDYSHGAYKASSYRIDQRLYTSLFLMGYEVVEVWGGLNATILADATGLVLPKIWGVASGYLASEVTAVGDWFNAGNKFLWIGGESDFVEADGGHVGSHVYHEPTAVQDSSSFAGASYRPVSNTTGTDPFVATIVNGVQEVFTHSPTCLYGSDSATPGENVTPVALETESIDNVYVLLAHSSNGTIVDSDLTLPYAHEDGEHGAFVTMTIEMKAGTAGTGVIVVSGGNVVGSYWAMMEDSYAGVVGMDGLYLVRQAIDFGMKEAAQAAAGLPLDPMLLAIIGIGVVVVIIIVVVVIRRK